MADVYDYVVETGVITTDTAVIQAGVEDEYKNAFGADLIVTPDTPQGMLITAEVLARKAVADNNAAVANQINPNLAGGVFLDAILALTGSQRKPASYTLVICNLTGVAGTIIPQGSQARDTVHNELFETVASVTLAIDGTASVEFKAVDPGPLTVGIATVTQIVSAILGWETVTNPAVQTFVGENEQTDAEARQLRRQTLALQGDALPYAIISALYETLGVESVSFRENVSSTTLVIDGVTMEPHSIYACVDGGTDEAVATVLLNKKSGGCGYNNGPGINVDYTIVVPYSGQTMHILFDRPNLINIYIRATVKADSSLQDPVTTVKQAILDYANGLLEGETGFAIGVSVSCFELAGAVNRVAPGIYVQNMETSLDGITYSNASIPIAIYQKAVTQSSSITVNVL